MSKYTNFERALVKSIVGSLTIKRVPESEIIKEVHNQTNKTLSRSGLYRVRQSIRKESFKWYSQLRESEYEYIHEFKERVMEIEFLQRKHYEIIDSNENNPAIQQGSLAALHKLSITLSNLYDVAPVIDKNQQRPFTGSSIEEDQNQARRMFRIEGCTCPHDGRDIISHSKCRHCLCIWCPTAMKQDWCPNPQCSSGIAGCKFEPYDDLRKWIKCKCGMWFKTQEIMDAHKEVSIACQDIIV